MQTSTATPPALANTPNAPSLITRSRQARDLWIAVMPADFPVPDLAQCVRWCDRFNDALIEKTILKLAYKVTKKPAPPRPILPKDGHRYFTGLLLNIACEAEQKQKSTAIL